MIQTASKRIIIDRFNRQKGSKYSEENPVSQLRVVKIRGVIGFNLNNTAAHPPGGIGNTTGVRYIKNCIIRGMALPMSVYSIPMGASNNPNAVPVRISERMPNGNKSNVYPG